MIRHTLIFLCIAASMLALPVSARRYWSPDVDGGITWHPRNGEIHSDHIEMAGKQVATVLRYGVGPSGEFTINKSMVWPLLRTIPNNTHASLMRRYDWDPIQIVTANGRSLSAEKVKNISLKGVMTVESEVDNGRYGSMRLRREYSPSTTLPLLVERYTIVNTGTKPLRIEIPDGGFHVVTDPTKGVTGAYCIDGKIIGAGAYEIAPADSLLFAATLGAYREGEKPESPDVNEEFASRRSFVDEIMHSLVLETPDTELNKMMDFAKIRACESIYATHGGPMHGPGGESYYAAIWANDQAEYINPFFPFTGYDYGNQSALNSYMHFARFMNPDFKPIPSSIIAEGDDIWNGAGDRGDAAMIAYGASRYVLARGDIKEARQLWPLITWCLEYCRRKLNSDGVVTSDSDELEGRFPSGDANLCTSSLYYDALVSASILGKELGDKNAARYKKEAATLRKNIDRYFSSNVQGFDTYAYYKGNDILRSWICIPLTVGIDERAEGTIAALFSPSLWTENGLLTQAGDKTFWDRSTLYALRGAFAVGATDKAMEYLKKYSDRRLLGDHVPYAIEAWPEGNQRHLSAESGLYARIITEGLFGIRPSGLRSFTLNPRLPDEWNHMSLRHIKAFGHNFDIHVSRKSPGLLNIKVIPRDGNQMNFTLKENTPLRITLKS